MRPSDHLASQHFKQPAPVPLVRTYHGQTYDIVWSGTIDRQAGGMLTSHRVWRSSVGQLMLASQLQHGRLK